MMKKMSKEFHDKQKLIEDIEKNLRKVHHRSPKQSAKHQIGWTAHSPLDFPAIPNKNSPHQNKITNYSPRDKKRSLFAR